MFLKIFYNTTSNWLGVQLLHLQPEATRTTKHRAMYCGGHFDILFFDIKTSNSSLSETDSIGDDRKSIVATIDVRTNLLSNFGARRKKRPPTSVSFNFFPVENNVLSLKVSDREIPIFFGHVPNSRTHSFGDGLVPGRKPSCIRPWLQRL